MGSCESTWNEDAKVGIEFVSSSNTSRENQQNAFHFSLIKNFGNARLVSQNSIQMYARRVF